MEEDEIRYYGELVEDMTGRPRLLDKTMKKKKVGGTDNDLDERRKKVVRDVIRAREEMGLVERSRERRLGVRKSRNPDIPLSALPTSFGCGRQRAEKVNAERPASGRRRPRARRPRRTARRWTCSSTATWRAR